jgi:hypothetical protein
MGSVHRSVEKMSAELFMVQNGEFGLLTRVESMMIVDLNIYIL